MSHDYSEFKDKTGDNLLAQISATAVEQKKKEAEVAELAEKLQLANEQLRNISEHVLPGLMDAASMTAFTTKEGIKIECSEKIRASIPAARADEAYVWLEENGLEHIIKRQFVIEFDREQEDWAKEFSKKLDAISKDLENPLNIKRIKNVHASTLAATIKEQLEEGINIPMATFGAYRQRFTKIK